MRRFVPLGGALLTLLAWLALAPPTAAFDVTGCTLKATSTDGSGASLDTAEGPGAGATADHPFLIDSSGNVHYDGASTGGKFGMHSYAVWVYGLPIPFITGGGNNTGEPQQTGDVSVGGVFPIKVAGVYLVSGNLAGETHSCSGSGWVKLTTDPIGAPQTWLAAALVALGIVGLIFSRPSWAGGAR